MYANFEPLKRNQLRINNYVGLFGPYFSMFQPKPNIDKQSSLEVVRMFKNPHTLYEEYLTNETIKISLNNFSLALKNNDWNGPHSLNDFGCIIKIPSQFLANDRICDILDKMINHKIPIHRNLYEKRMSQEVKLNHRVFEENSSKTLGHILKIFSEFKTSYFNQPFEIKHFGASKRRYFYNFLKLNYNISLFVRNKHILLLDDTIGEGVTIREASRLINVYNPKTITAFTVLRDYHRS